MERERSTKNQNSNAYGVANSAFNAMYADTIVGASASMERPLTNKFSIRHNKYSYKEALSILLKLKERDIKEDSLLNTSRKFGVQIMKYLFSKENDLTVISFKELTSKVMIKIGKTCIKINKDKTITLSSL